MSNYHQLLTKKPRLTVGLLCVSRRYRRKKKLQEYGAPSDDFDALLEGQSGVCAICKSDNDGRSFHIDHDHTTNQYRGLLCNGCNVGLGGFKDDPVAVHAAIDYLKNQ